MPFFDSGYVLPQFIKPIIGTVIDTIYVNTTPIEKGWFEKSVPILAVLVAIIGWFANSWFARKNQKLAFTEQVLDKLRIELNKYFTEYRDWLNEGRREIQMRLSTALPKNEKEVREWRTGWVKHWMDDDRGHAWIERFFEYLFLFPHFIVVRSDLNFRQNLIQGTSHDILDLVDKIKGNVIDMSTNPDKIKFQLVILDEVVFQQAKLFSDFFYYFQNACLDSIQNKLPIVPRKHDKYPYIDRNKIGMLYVIYPENKRVWRDINPDKRDTRLDIRLYE